MKGLGSNFDGMSSLPPVTDLELGTAQGEGQPER
jgi:hypothetical protein